MIYAVELFFDTYSEASIQSIWTAFNDKSISTYMMNMGARPHITLGIFHDVDEHRFMDELQAFAKENDAFPIQFSSLGIFTSPKACLFLAPVVTKELLRLHTDFHVRFTTYDHKGWEYYLPGQWVPHCALDIALATVGIEHSTSYMMDCFTPQQVMIKDIGLVRVEKPITYLSSYPLGSSE